MIQDIKGHSFDPIYKNILPKDDDYVLCYRKNRVYLINNSLPLVKDINKNNLIYGFSIDDKNYFIDYVECKNANTELEIFRKFEPRHMSFAIITGYHLYCWYMTNKMCGCCGNELSFGFTERKMVCSSCNNQIFPHISPAVIVGIIHNDKILLTKYKEGYSEYALVAGYSEIGETLEDTVRREVLEEVGLHVTNIKYYKSQPWGLSGSLLAGFFAEVYSEEDIVLQEDELKEAKWFSKDEINLEDDRTSITREMILLFKNK